MKDVTRFWFPQWNVICEKSGEDLYWVVNGAWGFHYDPVAKTRRVQYTKGKVDSKDAPSEMVEVTKEEFEKLSPSFGYW